MENFIKEIKSGFYFGETDSYAFLTNAIQIMFSGIAYNLMQLMKCSILLKIEVKFFMNLIHFRLIKGASRLTDPSR